MAHRAPLRSICLIALAFMVVAGGCGPSAPALVPLSGTLTVDGRPLARGMIQFEADSGGATAVATVTDGHFTATTAGRRGIVPGRYTARLEARAEPTDETDTLPKSLVATKYADAATSGLTCEAVAGRDNSVEWNLEAAP